MLITSFWKWNAVSHLLQPLGYSVDDTKLKRAGLDYWPYPLVKMTRKIARNHIWGQAYEFLLFVVWQNVWFHDSTKTGSSWSTYLVYPYIVEVCTELNSYEIDMWLLRSMAHGRNSWTILGNRWTVIPFTEYFVSYLCLNFLCSFWQWSFAGWRKKITSIYQERHTNSFSELSWLIRLIWNNKFGRSCVSTVIICMSDLGL